MASRNGSVSDSGSTSRIESFGPYAARLRGATTVVVGIQPEVAFAMVQLGLSLDGVLTGLDLEEGVELIAQQRQRSHGD